MCNTVSIFHINRRKLTAIIIRFFQNVVVITRLFGIKRKKSIALSRNSKQIKHYVYLIKMGSLFAITTILSAAFLMQTAISIPVGDKETANSTEVRDQETANSTISFDDLWNLCPCNKCYDPVCGSDNHTYANQCLFDCAKEHRNPNLEVQFYGDCDGNQLTITLDDCIFGEGDYPIDSKAASEEEKQEEEKKEEEEEKQEDSE